MNVPKIVKSKAADLERVKSVLTLGFSSDALLRWIFPDASSYLRCFNIWMEEFSKIKNYDKTLRVCHSTVGVAILNTSITIVFGFSILVLSNFIPTIYFGIFTGIAMLLAMISVLTLLPSLLLVVKPFSIK